MSNENLNVVIKQAPTYNAPMKHYELREEKSGKLVDSLSATSVGLAGVLFRNRINFGDLPRNLVPKGF